MIIRAEIFLFYGHRLITALFLSSAQIAWFRPVLYLCLPVLSCWVLAPMLLSEKPVQKHRVGIVPHYAEKDEPLVQKMLSFYEDSILINVQEKTRDVAWKIAECDVFISTSLHVLSVANSFGIPNQ